MVGSKEALRHSLRLLTRVDSNNVLSFALLCLDHSRYHDLILLELYP
jgi:hypothetical protein